MTKNKTLTAFAIIAVVLTITTSSCKKDSPAPTTTYQLKTKDQLGVYGTVKFTQLNSTSTTIDIVLTGSDATSHPAHIHLNSAIEGGAIAISLNPIVNGKSTTLVSTLDNLTTVNYSQLIAFDGYLNVHESDTNLSTIIAQGDIGGNTLTGTTKTYTLDSIGGLGVSGSVIFEKRNNGNTLATISVIGTIAGDIYPAAIHLGSVTTVGGGPITKTLNSIDGTTAKSFTNIRTLDTGTALTYDNLLAYDGYISVLQSTTSSTILCQGNIGTH